MRVTCHRDDEPFARAAGHLVVTENPEAFYFHEAPDNETIERLAEHGTLPVIIEMDGCTVETHFPSWADGWLGRMKRHARRTRAGVRRAAEEGRLPRRKIRPQTEMFVRGLLDLGLPLKHIARQARIDVKTVKRVRDDMENPK